MMHFLPAQMLESKCRLLLQLQQQQQRFREAVKIDTFIFDQGLQEKKIIHGRIVHLCNHEQGVRWQIK
jgi:hypothetical protein